jgi:DNA-binding transcriptional MerR regulator
MSNLNSDQSGKAEFDLAGRRIALVGRFAAMNQRDTAQLLRDRGASVVDRPGANVDWIVLGEKEIPSGADVAEGVALDETFSPEIQTSIQKGQTELIGETELWQRLGVSECMPDSGQQYTSAMLAELLEVPLAVIRRWQRRRLIRPVREVRHLAYFDFQEVATARRLAQLLGGGATLSAIEKKIEALSRYLPGVERPLTQLAVMIQGGDILLQGENGLVEPGGQMRFDFGTVEPSESEERKDREIDLSFLSSEEEPTLSIEAYREEIGALGSVGSAKGGQSVDSDHPVDRLIEMAVKLEESGLLSGAAEAYRAAMAAGGPTAELNFRTAELLYQLGDLPAARERFYMSIELDEGYVEARANLGCVLAELGENSLAAAAFEGALSFHADYADAHYHLARLLDTLGRAEQAVPHWEAFLLLAPQSVWADEARQRL